MEAWACPRPPVAPGPWGAEAEAVLPRAYARGPDLLVHYLPVQEQDPLVHHPPSVREEAPLARPRAAEVNARRAQLALAPAESWGLSPDSVAVPKMAETDLWVAPTRRA